MDATCAIQDSIHVFSLVRKYVSRILGTYQNGSPGAYSKFSEVRIYFWLAGLLPSVRFSSMDTYSPF